MIIQRQGTEMKQISELPEKLTVFAKFDPVPDFSKTNFLNQTCREKPQLANEYLFTFIELKLRKLC